MSSVLGESINAMVLNCFKFFYILLHNRIWSEQKGKRLLFSLSEVDAFGPNPLRVDQQFVCGLDMAPMNKPLYQVAHQSELWVFC